jgi:NADH-quinone oxidoreductase subunit K
MNFDYNLYFLYVSVIFIIALVSFFISRKNYFFLLISLEIFFISINLNFAVSSVYNDSVAGIVFVMFILAVSGAEIALGLALYILLHRRAVISHMYTLQNIKG